MSEYIHNSAEPSHHATFSELIALVRDQQRYILELDQKLTTLNRNVLEKSLDHFLTVKEVAKFLGVSEQHVNDLCNQGLITNTMIGRVRRIQQRDLNDYIEKYTTKALGRTNYHTRPGATRRNKAKRSI